MTTRGGEPEAVDVAGGIGESYCAELLAMRKRGEITKDELFAECAKLVLQNIDDMRFRPYPTKSELIKKLCGLSERERNRQLEEKATTREREEVRTYCENFSRAWSQNYSNYHALAGAEGEKGIIELLEDADDIAKLANFIEENFEPKQTKVFCKPFDQDFTSLPGRRWNGYQDILIVGAVIATQGVML